MTTTPLPPLREFVVYSGGKPDDRSACVCTSLTDEQVLARFATERATGFGWEWRIGRTDDCDDSPRTHRHLLLQLVRTTERTEA